MPGSTSSNTKTSETNQEELFGKFSLVVAEMEKREFAKCSKLCIEFIVSFASIEKVNEISITLHCMNACSYIALGICYHGLKNVKQSIINLNKSIQSFANIITSLNREECINISDNLTSDDATLFKTIQLISILCQSFAYFYMGQVYHDQEDSEESLVKSLACFDKCVQVREAIDKEGINLSQGLQKDLYNFVYKIVYLNGTVQEIHFNRGLVFRSTAKNTTDTNQKVDLLLKSIDSFKLSYQYALENHDYSSQALALFGLAGVYMNLPFPKESKEFITVMEQSIKLYNHVEQMSIVLKDKNLLAQTYHNLGIVYSKLNDLKRAQKYFEMKIEMVKSELGIKQSSTQKKLDGNQSIDHAFSDIFKEISQFDQTILQYKKIIKQHLNMYREHRNKYRKDVRKAIHEASLLLNKGLNQKAINLLEHALVISKMAQSSSSFPSNSINQNNHLNIQLDETDTTSLLHSLNENITSNQLLQEAYLKMNDPANALRAAYFDHERKLMDLFFRRCMKLFSLTNHLFYSIVYEGVTRKDMFIYIYFVQVFDEYVNEAPRMQVDAKRVNIFKKLSDSIPAEHIEEGHILKLVLQMKSESSQQNSRELLFSLLLEPYYKEVVLTQTGPIMVHSNCEVFNSLIFQQLIPPSSLNESPILISMMHDSNHSTILHKWDSVEDEDDDSADEGEFEPDVLILIDEEEQIKELQTLQKRLPTDSIEYMIYDREEDEITNNDIVLVLTEDRKLVALQDLVLAKAHLRVVAYCSVQESSQQEVDKLVANNFNKSIISKRGTIVVNIHASANSILCSHQCQLELASLLEYLANNQWEKVIKSVQSLTVFQVSFSII